MSTPRPELRVGNRLPYVTITCDETRGIPARPGANSSVHVAPMSVSSPMIESAISARFASLESMIGNTPLLAIDYEVGGRRRTIYAKSEQMNFTGSIKDRMALHILRQAYTEGRIHPG